MGAITIHRRSEWPTERGRREAPSPAGRIHFIPPSNVPVAQLDRALPSEGRGCRFNSRRAHHLALYLTGVEVSRAYQCDHKEH